MIAADHLAFLLNQPLGEVCRSGDLLARGLILARKIYRPDFLIVFSDVSVEAEALGVRLEYPADKNPQPLRHVPVSEIRRVNMAESGRLPELFRAAEICRAEFEKDFTLFFSLKDPLSLAAMTLGTEDFFQLLVTDPAEANEILHICCENQIELVETIVKSGFIPFIGAPISTGDLIGATHFRNFAQPYLARLFEAARKEDSFACLHLCGKVSGLADCLGELKPDLLSFEDADIVPLWNKLPDTIPMGYIPTDLFVYGNEKSVESSVKTCLRSLPPPFVLSTGCDLPAKSRKELVKVMMKALMND